MLLTLAGGAYAVTVFATQAPGKAPALSLATSVEDNLRLAEQGRCREALPRLKNAATHIRDKELKHKTAMATARCAMSPDEAETAVGALLSQ
jgi:hypothetical protein